MPGKSAIWMSKWSFSSREFRNGSATVDRRNLTQALQQKRSRQADRLAAAARKIERSKLFTHLQKIEAQAMTQPDSFGDDVNPFTAG